MQENVDNGNIYLRFLTAFYDFLQKLFLSSRPNVPLLLPAPNCKGCIFGLTRQKNCIHNTVIKRTTPEHIC